MISRNSPHVPLHGRELTSRVEICELPKVLLHEHLDGGLRPSTVIRCRDMGVVGFDLAGGEHGYPAKNMWMPSKRSSVRISTSILSLSDQI